MSATEADLIGAANRVADAALALEESVRAARRQRRFNFAFAAAIALLLLLTLAQSRQNGEVIHVVREATSEEAQARSQERLQGAIEAVVAGVRAEIAEAHQATVRCLLGRGPCP